jgi:hypothetical protein
MSTGFSAFRISALAASARTSASTFLAQGLGRLPGIAEQCAIDSQSRDHEHGHAALTNARNQMLGMAMEDNAVIQVRPNGLEDAPQLKVDLDLARYCVTPKSAGEATISECEKGSIRPQRKFSAPATITSFRAPPIGPA